VVHRRLLLGQTPRIWFRTGSGLRHKARHSGEVATQRTTRRGWPLCADPYVACRRSGNGRFRQPAKSASPCCQRAVPGAMLTFEAPMTASTFTADARADRRKQPHFFHHDPEGVSESDCFLRVQECRPAPSQRAPPRFAAQRHRPSVEAGAEAIESGNRPGAAAAPP